MQPSDQGIETVVWIPVIDYRNTRVASRKPSTGRMSHSFPASTKMRLGEGWLVVIPLLEPRPVESG